MKIFISYRRDDSVGYAGRLFDHLAARFGAKHVFMDIDTIEPGEDFRKVVENAIGTCDVVLALIGRQWLNMPDAQGRRRLDDPRDWVHIEIATALANPRIRVIPVLVRDASMPGNHDLPDNLKELAGRLRHQCLPIDRGRTEMYPAPPWGYKYDYNDRNLDEFWLYRL